MSETSVQAVARASEARDPDVAWLLVGTSRDRVEPYLYSSAVVVSATEGEGYGPLTLIVVCGRPGRSDATYLALYQADRIRSGLMPVWVCETYATAYRAADRFHAGEDPA